jgi:uncharacterized protein (TIGR03032 family)
LKREAASWESAYCIRMTEKAEEQSENSAEEIKEPVVGFTHSPGLLDLFKQLKISLLVSTYQAQRILLFTAGERKLSMLMRSFERPTGLAYDGKRLALCSKRQIWIFEQAFNLRSPEGEEMPNDVTFVPRKSYVTGDILGHEIAWLGGKLVFINTRFSCLSAVSEHFSFKSVWQPRFVTDLVAEDRCHLNGMALNENGVQFVTALGETNSPEGWRDNKRDGGILLHVPTGEIVCRKLCMPHSPRIYANRLWLLDSGMGELQIVDPTNGVREPVCRLPGYLRGLTFFDRFAFVGLSKIRESNIFGGLPISEKIADLKCAVYVIDLGTGQPVGLIEFTKGIEELFDLTIIPNFTTPGIIGFEEDVVDGLYIMAPG